MKGVQPRHIFSLVVIGSIALAAVVLNKPLFNNLDQFVLAADEGIHLGERVQISSGDIAVNGKLRISGSNIINGSLWADEIRIAGDTQINGNAAFNKLHVANGSEVLGTTEESVSLPIVELPDIPGFQSGEDDLIIEGEETINPQNLNRLEVTEGAKLTLNPGTYNLNELALRDNAKLIFTATATINIKQTFNAGNNVFIAPLDPQTSPKALTINVVSESKATSKGKGKHEPNGNQPINIGNNSFLSFKLLAPNTKVILGERTTFRGQIIAREIQVGESGVLSKDIAMALQPRPEDIITTEAGSGFVINQVIVQLVPTATFEDAVSIAELINGTVVGAVPSINLYQLSIPIRTAGELENALNIVSSNSLVKVVSKNSMISLIE